LKESKVKAFVTVTRVFPGGKRAGLKTFAVSVREETATGKLLQGPFIVPDYNIIKFRNTLCEQLDEQYNEVEAEVIMSDTDTERALHLQAIVAHGCTFPIAYKALATTTTNTDAQALCEILTPGHPNYGKESKHAKR
jgi:uncharacterized Fe-S center protein